MISVVIPFINQSKLLVSLLQDISDNTVKPDQIILIDNASSENMYSFIRPFKKSLNILYLRQLQNIGVNPSWNLGISRSTSSLISILNNDIILNKYFFQYILQVMNDFGVGICVPYTVKNIDIIRNQEKGIPIYKPLGKREGWAFTIRKEITDKIRPIPKELNRVCGDDYLFYWSAKLGYKNVKILNNYVYHYGSITAVEELKGKAPKLKEEKALWLKIREKYEDHK